MDNLIVDLRRFSYGWMTEEVADFSGVMDNMIEYFNYLYTTYTEKAPDLVADRWTSTFCHHLGATIPLSSHLMNVTKEGGRNCFNKREFRAVTMLDVQMTPGGTAAYQALQKALQATRSFLLTGETPQHKAFARAVLVELEAVDDGETAISAEWR